ncbi:MAG: ankyrin repeat domain-containing protein [Elusimicrobiales bacterium]|nr:ankyrin repeat domain-containing protein [Elusimicrobiales bacterium]
MFLELNWQFKKGKETGKIGRYNLAGFLNMFNLKRKYFFNFILIISFMSMGACNLQTDPAIMLDVAIRNGDVAKVKQLLSDGALVEPKNRKSWSPLTIAVIKNKPEIADLLLKHGANINVRYKSQTLLHMACRWGKNDMVEYLLKKGLSVRKRDWLSWTPLMWASLQGKKDIVKTLVDWGADINATDVDKNTPLILAVWRGHADTAKFLVSRGADLSAVNNEGLNAAGKAKKHEFHKLAEELEALAKKTK